MPGPQSEKGGGESPTARAFWTYLDVDGNQHIVDSLEVIPEKYRAAAEKVDLSRRVAEGKGKARKLKREVGDVVEFIEDLHGPSISVGFAGALAFLLVLSLVRRTGRLVFRLALLVGIVVFLGGAYFGWMRQVAGLGAARFSSPAEIIEDAEKAAEKMRSKLKETEETLNRVEEGVR